MNTQYRYILLFLIMVSFSAAHRVNVFAYTEGNYVVCECFYNDGNPVKTQPVQISTADGRTLTEGKTDKEGIFKFLPSVLEDLVITVDAGMGHIAKTTIAREDLPQPEPKITTQKSSPAKPIKNPQASEEKSLTEEQVREIVERVVEEKIHPLVHLIQKQQQKQSLIAIIGGIGYIFGIFGLIVFFKSRKKK